MIYEYVKPYYERNICLGDPRSDDWLAKNDLWITAVHEAAHVVVAYQNGLNIEEVRLRKENALSSNGYILISETQTKLFYVREMISMLMAGNIASNIEMRKSVWYRAGRDEKRALTLIFRLLYHGDEDFDSLEKERQDWIAWTYRDECFRTAIRDVTAPETWRVIRKFARTIHKCRVLRFSQLRVVLFRLTQSVVNMDCATQRRGRIAQISKKVVVTAQIKRKRPLPRSRKTSAV